MAVTSVKILHNGWTGSASASSGIEFNVVYQVEVSDKNDGPLVVLQDDELPSIGQIYEVGNDFDPFAFVKSLSPSPMGEKIWQVVVNYGPAIPEGEGSSNGVSTEGLDEEGKPTDDPLEIAARISVSSVLAKRAAQHGAYLGRVTANLGGGFEYNPAHIIADRPPIPNPPFTTANLKGGIDDRTPITNSVFTPFDPPPEIDYTRTRISISMNLRFAPFWMKRYVNSVNKSKVWFTNALGDTIASADPFAAKVMGVGYQARILDGKMFWATDVDILVDELFTWRLEILDRGYCDTTNEGVSEGATKKNIVDKNGLPLAEPVLLNGQGSQLDLEQANAVYLVYGVYPEEDFNAGEFSIANPQDLQNRIN